MKNIKKLIMILIIFTLSINFPFSTVKATDNTDQNINKSFKLEKTATPTEKDGEYEISLKVQKNSQEIAKPVDIVLILDNSSTMEYKLSDIKKSVNNFIDNISNKVKNARVEVVLFSEYPSVLMPNDASENSNGFIDLSNKIAVNNLKTAVNRIKLSWGTNTEAVFQKVDEQFLDYSSPDSKKYEVFFTDGLPDMINGDHHIISNRKAIPKAEKAYDDLTYDNHPINTYSIGFLGDLSRRHFKEARRFLKHVQNSGFYEASDLESIDRIYGQIAENIITNNTLGKDVLITDTVTGPFTIEKDGYGKGIASKVTLDSKEIDVNNGIQNINKNTISWNFGDLDNGKLTIKFKIKVIDPYYGGQKIYTNENATFHCVDSITNKTIDLTFNKPTVNIPYKIVNINLQKTISDGSKNSEYFTICLDGGVNGKYYFKIPANGEKIHMNAYLKDKKTDTSNNTDTSKNYLIAGKYKVTELDSLSYTLNSIIVNNKKLSPNNNEITIDKDNKDINISIVNNKKGVYGVNNPKGILGFFDFNGIENVVGKFIGLK